ncbi:MAG: hypothetical protein ABUS56_13590 [Acidobacteriota bacterium]
MRRTPLPVLFCLAVLTSGCFQFSTVLTVKGDGSGTIDQRLLFTQAAVAQLRQFGALAGGGQNMEPVSEQQARETAATMGPGVTYVSSTPVDTPEGVGRDIRYAFTDISTVSLEQAPPAPGGLAVGSGAGAGARVSFAFSHQPDGHAVLTVVVPRMPFAGGSQPAGISAMPPANQIAMLRPMLAGARMSVVIETNGALVRTSSPYVAGSRVTVLDVSLDALLNDAALLPQLQAAKSPDEAKALLANIPGIKVNLDPELTIEFAPR